MWQSVSDVNGASTSKRSSWKQSTSSVATTRTHKSEGLLKRALSFQFLNKQDMPEGLNKDEKAFIKMRYKDVAKHVIWPSCPLPEKGAPIPGNSGRAPIQPLSDAQKSLMKAEIEDHRTPYLPCTINSVLRSDSEDSSDAEEIVQMTRL